MRKIFTVMALSIFLTIFAGGPVFAGVTWVNNGGANAAFNVSSETLGAARNLTITGAVPVMPVNNTDSAVSYVISTNLTSGYVVNVNLTNCAFTGNPVFLCGFNQNGNQIDLTQGTPAAGSTSHSFVAAPAGANIVPAGNVVWLANTSIATGTNCGQLTLQKTADTSPGQVRIDMTYFGSTVDAASTATAFTPTRERTPVITTRNMTIDYLSAPFNGTLFTAGSSGGVTARNVAGNAGLAFNIGYTATDYHLGAVAGALNAGLTSSAVVNFDSSSDWTGVNRVWLGTNSTAAANNLSNIVSNPSGAVALNWATSAYNQTVALDKGCMLYVEVDGATQLPARTLQGNLTVNVAGTGANPLAPATGIFQIWGTNGYQAYVPHVRYGETTRTFIRLVNNSANAMNLMGNIITGDGTTIIGADLGVTSIGAGQTITLNGQTVGELNGLGATNNYALSLYGAGTAEAIFTNAYFNLLAGGVWTTRDVTVYDSAKNGYGLK